MVLPNSSAFEGPKDHDKAMEYMQVVQEMLQTEYISCDMRDWPPSWRRVLRFRACTASDNAALPVLDQPPYIFEVFAANIRIHHSRIRKDRLLKLTAAEAAPAAAAAAQDAAEVTPTFNLTDYMAANTPPEACELAAGLPGGSGRADGENAADESSAADEGGTRDSMESAEKEVDGEDESTRASKLRDQDVMLSHLGFTLGLSGGWVGSAAVKEEVEDMAATFIVVESVARASGSPQCSFLNPFYLQAPRGGSGAKRDELVLPVASLFQYHARLFVATGPLVRKILPSLVSHSSHVEGKFSDMRKETAGSLPIEEYLRVKTTGTDSLMAADVAAFNASTANSQRRIISRPRADHGTSTALATEGMQNYDPLQCLARILKGTQCTSRYTLGCPHHRCQRGRHCPDDECPVHRKKHLAALHAPAAIATASAALHPDSAAIVTADASADAAVD